VRHDFESPFLDTELSAREATPEWEPRASAVAAESPFVDPMVAGPAGERENERESEAWDEGESGTKPITTLKMRKDEPVHARILWPALGFPAVIAPRGGRAADSPMKDGDATRCITVLLLSNRKNLSKAEAARYLRVTTWGDRERRHLGEDAKGAFREEELAVRNHEAGPKLTVPVAACNVPKPPAWCLGDIVIFGGNGVGANVIAVNLARRVRSFYAKQELKYLHEIRISEEASNRLADGRYNLFWNNEAANEKAASDELRLLLEQFAAPRRDQLSAHWREQKNHEYLLFEYEYEYGVNHPPYVAKLAARRPRTEILHPLFVDRHRQGELKIGHLTDMHVDVRADIYEENLKQAPAGRRKSFNNYNRSFIDVYDAAKASADVILMTGDLIDYGRGHLGLSERGRVAEDEAYHVDRNWFLFYYLLASKDEYTRPVYTCLGNHDWRINPYPPFASGAPGATSLFDDYGTFNRRRPADPAKRAEYDKTLAEARALLELAHGDGHTLRFSYSSDATSELHLLKEDQDPKQRAANFKAVLGMFLQRKTLDVRNFPTETTVESVAWYLLAINPFLDYLLPLPGGYHVLMLDWAEDEDLLFPVTLGGKDYPYFVWALNDAGDPGQKARNSLNPIQKTLLEQLARTPGRAKVIGIHAPPIGPFPDWTDEDLSRGRHSYDSKATARGPMDYVVVKPDGTKEKINGHPLFAIRPKNGAQGMEAHHGSFSNNRDVFINTAAKSGVRLVLAGHIHRNGLYVVHKPGPAKGAAVAGELLIRRVLPNDVAGAKPPAVSATPEGQQGPLYVNTTSAGPRGNYHPRKGESYHIAPGWAFAELAPDGTIRQVEFRSRLTQPKTAGSQRETFARVG